MSTNKRDRQFDSAQADKTFYEIGSHIRGVKGILVAALDMSKLEDAHDILALARDTLDRVVEVYERSHELDWSHLMRRYEFGSTIKIMVDMLACASDPSFDEVWKKKAITLYDRIRNHIYPDDRPVILRAWADLIGARGLKVCLIDGKTGERKPLFEERPSATEQSASASCG